MWAFRVNKSSLAETSQFSKQAASSAFHLQIVFHSFTNSFQVFYKFLTHQKLQLVARRVSIGLPFWPPTRGFGPVSKKTRSEEEGSHTIRPGVESWIFACIKCACGVWRSQCVGHLAWNKDVRTKEEDRTYHARLSSNPSLLVQWELQLDRTFFWYASGQKSHWRPKV